MNDWLSLNTDDLNVERVETIRGVEVKVFLSPYDVPEAVRGTYDKTIKRFVIEFQYISDEPLKRQFYDKYVDLKIGKNSRRLYAIEIDVDALKATSIEVQMGIRQEVANALDSLLHSPINAQRRGNYHLVQQAISTKQDQLFAPFAKSNSGAPLTS
jgi:hypothetical protein